MILTCPSCRARYVVPDSAIGIDGRKVRCAQCRFSWFQEGPDQPLPSAPPRPAPQPRPVQERPPQPVYREPPPEPEPEPEPTPEPAYEEPAPEPEAIDWAPAEGEQEWEEPSRPRRNPARLWTIVAIIAALLMVGALAALYYFGPQQIAAWMGADSAPQGDALQFTRRDVTREPLPTDKELLTVTGEITNTSGEVQRVPQIRAEVTDAAGNVTYSWTIAPPIRELQPRQAVTFSSASTDVPKGGRSLSLSFGPVT